MRLTKIIILLVLGTLCINARVIKRQKKIKRVLPKQSPTCGCQRSVIELPSVNTLLESAYGCLGACGFPDACGCKNIFLEESPCGGNYGINCIDGYGINAGVTSYDRIPAIRLPKTLASIDAGIQVPAINLPALYQFDVPSCQCQNALPYQILDSPCVCKRPTYEFLNPIDVPSQIITMPVESIIQSVLFDAARPVVKLPNCGCQMPTVEVCGCQRQKCGCQLSSLEIPCSCQLPALSSLCGCQYSALDVPCGCNLPAFNLPCGYQLPSLDCGCQLQAFNSPCGCQLPHGAPCGCQLPVPNIPYAFQLSSLDVPCGYQLPSLDVPCSCGCQLPGCGCQNVLPPVVGCGKHLRQVTLQPPFL